MMKEEDTLTVIGCAQNFISQTRLIIIAQDNYTKHQHVLIKKHKIQLHYTYALPALLWFGHLEKKNLATSSAS